MSESTASQLNDRSQVGDRVWWTTFGGDRYEGILIEWDNGTAIVRLDNGNIRAA